MKKVKEPQIKLMSDWVLVLHDDQMEQERKTGAGVIVPQGSYTDPSEIMCWGEVVRTGPGRWNKKGTSRLKLDCKPGDRVLYNRFNKRTKTGEAIAEVIGSEWALLQEHKDIVALEPQE